MHSGPLIILNPSRPHCCSLPKCWDSIGADITLLVNGNYFFNFHQSCSLRSFTGTHPVLSSMAHRPAISCEVHISPFHQPNLSVMLLIAPIRWVFRGW